MQAVILHCKPGSRFHFGDTAPDADTALNDTSDYCHSDTLFGAFVQIAALLAPQGAPVGALIDAFKTGEVRISSVFPCLQLSKTHPLIYFFPKPAHYDTYADPEDIKKMSSIAFISKGVWESKMLPDRWTRALEDKKLVLLQERFLVLRSELSAAALSARAYLKLLHQTEWPKVTVHQLDQEGSLFQHGTLQTADNSLLTDDTEKPILPDCSTHFYFLLDCNATFLQTSTHALLKNVLDLLPDTGLGGDRSTGCGLLEAISFDESFALNLQAKMLASLSLINPNGTEEAQKLYRYRTQLRGGRRTATDRYPLQFVRMVSEGALLAGKIEGRIPDVSPPNSTLPYLRNGKAFLVPVAS